MWSLNMANLFISGLISLNQMYWNSMYKMNSDGSAQMDLCTHILSGSVAKMAHQNTFIAR